MIYTTHLHTFDENYESYKKHYEKYTIEKVTRAEVLDKVLLLLCNNPGDVTVTIENRDFTFMKDRGDVIDAYTGEIMCIYDDEYYRIQTNDWFLEEYHDDYVLSHGFVKITRK